MPVFYVARKKVDKNGETPKERYYATVKTIQKRGKGVTTKTLADELAEDSSLTSGDVFSTLDQLPRKIVMHLKEGRTVTIKGLGTFYLSVKSEGVETPEECSPKTIEAVRICFRPDKDMQSRLLRKLEFVLTEAEPEKRKSKTADKAE